MEDFLQFIGILIFLNLPKPCIKYLLQQLSTPHPPTPLLKERGAGNIRFQTKLPKPFKPLNHFRIFAFSNFHICFFLLTSHQLIPPIAAAAARDKRMIRV